MDGAEAAGMGGAWSSIRGYFTPATLFLVVNLVIGTIALTSRSHQRRRRQIYHHHDAAAGHHHPEMIHQEYGGQYYGGEHHQEQDTLFAPPPLVRTSSVLDRLRSFGLYRFRSGDFPPEFAAAAPTSHHQSEEEVVVAPVDEAKQGHYARSQSEPAAAMAQEERKAAKSRLRNSSTEVRRAEVVRAPARVVEAAFTEETAGDFAPEKRDFVSEQEEEYVPPPAPLARTSSVLDRLRSFSLYRFRSGELAAADGDTPAAEKNVATDEKSKQAAAAHYGRSRSEPAREQSKKAKKQAATETKTMTKSSSEARKAPAPAEDGDDGGVDARADDFINKFRQQLQLQRLNSLLNYKEMLNRGSSKQ
uniref:DUF4408 domain-containing protein n=1 Tax=Leersia perrieri TaxID=77586 RepID=A0A0D9WJ78_9ORYZ